jgi:hypothetical protein
VPALDTATYFVHFDLSISKDTNAYTRSEVVEVISTQKAKSNSGESRYVKRTQSSKDIMIENDFVQATFSTSGLLKSLRDIRTNHAVQLKQRFLAYNTKESGAYLFRPTTEKALDASVDWVRRIDGPIVTSIALGYGRFSIVASLVKTEHREVGDSLRLVQTVGEGRMCVTCESESIVRVRCERALLCLCFSLFLLLILVCVSGASFLTISFDIS